jgi:uncharacterized UBP type Zn finger protein
MSVYEKAIVSNIEKDHETKFENRYKYNLYAIISHIGEIGIGHYIAYIKYKYYQKEHWVLYDGLKTSQVFDKHIFGKQKN